MPIFCSSLLQRKSNYGESTSKLIDQEIRKLAIQALNDCINLLTPKRELMDFLVNALVEEEILDAERFDYLINSTIKKNPKTLSIVPIPE